VRSLSVQNAKLHFFLNVQINVHSVGTIVSLTKLTELLEIYSAKLSSNVCTEIKDVRKYASTVIYSDIRTTVQQLYLDVSNVIMLATMMRK
jgi:hypothetical protein